LKADTEPIAIIGYELVEQSPRNDELQSGEVLKACQKRPVGFGWALETDPGVASASALALNEGR